MSGTMNSDEQQFFEQGESPLEEVLEEPKFVFESPAVQARRARLRRIVAAALLASLMLCVVGLLVSYRTKRARALLDRQALNPRVTFQASLPQAPTEQLPATPVSAANPAPGPSIAAPSVPSDRSALIRAARALLEAGHTREGVAAARLAVDANSSDAEPYILLAAGLQDEGRWAEAQSVFSLCKQKTSSGPNATCRYFAGH
jgi:hypothetical protein